MSTLCPREESLRHHLPNQTIAKSAEGLDPLRTIKALWQLLLVWQTRIREREHLAQLESHLRRDMGLSDAQIAEEVRKPFWRA